MLGEIFLAKFLTSIFGLFLSFLFIYLPIILAIIAYHRKWGIKKFLKRVVESITLIITVIIVVVGVLGLLGHFTEKKDPVEEMVNNPQKYKNMLCFEVEFNKEKYCFDRSKSYFKNKYVGRTTKEDESAVIYFLPKALAHLPPEEREVRIDLKVDKYHRDDVNEPERFVMNFLKDKSMRDVVFNQLVNDSNNKGFYQISNLLKFTTSYSKDRHFINTKNSRILMRLNIEPSNDTYKFIADIVFQNPSERNYFEIHFVSNQPTQKEFLQTSLNIAQEFNQFLTDSKVTNQPLSTSSTTN